MALDECRRFYAQEVRFAAGLKSPALIEAFARVPREKFLGPPPWHLGSPEAVGRSMAGLGNLNYQESSNSQDVYHNVVIALDRAADINNGQPSALARWIEALDLKPGDHVYHLGCGVGYYTAILAEVVGPGGNVMGSEVHSGLAARARESLASYPNVTVYAGDGAAFDPGVRDAILVNAGCTHPLPAWLQALREGGRLVLPLTIPVSATLGQGPMVRITRRRDGFAAEVVTFVGIYSCTSARDPQLQPLLMKALTTKSLLKLKSVRLDPHDADDTCSVHGPAVCLSTRELAQS
jgi:protein-L-isoaspartate(D-aspartate) O-methyltransferase